MNRVSGLILCHGFSMETHSLTLVAQEVRLNVKGKCNI